MTEGLIIKPRPCICDDKSTCLESKKRRSNLISGYGFGGLLVETKL